MDNTRIIGLWLKNGMSVEVDSNCVEIRYVRDVQGSYYQILLTQNEIWEETTEIEAKDVLAVVRRTMNEERMGFEYGE